MNRRSTVFALAFAAAALAAPALRADVKTTEKATLKLEGLLGKFLGGAAKDGIVSTLAVKGNRMSSMNDKTGEIVDLTEEKVYRIDVKKKEYKVVTFAQLRKEWADAKAEAEKNTKELREAQGETEASGKKLEMSADIKETGQRKSTAGYDAREVVMTITTREEGKTLEEGGGSVMTNTLWIGPRIPALDEINQFQVKYMKAVMGEDGAAAMQQLAMVFAMFVSAQPMMEKMQTEGRKLEGSVLTSSMVMETVKSAEQMKAAASQQPSSGGGMSGMLAKKMMGGPPKQRSTVMTTANETLTVATSAGDTDVAIPAGFKEKK